MFQFNGKRSDTVIYKISVGCTLSKSYILFQYDLIYHYINNVIP